MTTTDSNIHSIVSKSPKETWPILAGMASFGSTLALSTWTQLKILGVSTGTRPPFIPSSLGVVSVGLASLASHQAAIATHGYLQEFRKQQRIRSRSILEQLPDATRRRCTMDVRASSGSSLDHDYRAGFFSRNDQLDVMGIVQIPMHTVRICVVGLITFKLLGGRCWGVSPSSFTNIGSFARGHIPATEQYAHAAQRATIERMGRIFGCHTCGSHQLLGPSLFQKVKFVGDHMPPKSVAEQINSRWYNRLLGQQVKFRFYPQCTRCSSRQGSILSAAVQQSTKQNLAKAGGGKLAHFHGLKPRISHLTGGVVAGLTVVGATDYDIQKGNPRRFLNIHKQIEDHLRRLSGRFWKIP